MMKINARIIASAYKDFVCILKLRSKVYKYKQNSYRRRVDE